ncbi:MipA/OmpV family protein, partial [Wohlfahrtiimonas larvae]
IVGYNSRYNNYYYGISANESYRSGLTQYKSKAGINPYAELSVVYQVAPQWEMSVTGRYEYLSKKVRNSPMVNKKESSLLKLGVLYQF